MKNKVAPPVAVQGRSVPTPTEGLSITFNYLQNNISSAEELSAQILSILTGSAGKAGETQPASSSIVGRADDMLTRMQRVTETLASIVAAL